MKKAYVEVYGCSFAQAEGEIIKGILSENGYSFSSEEDSDLIVLVTCQVKETTENKILFRLRELRDKYPNKKIIAYGCLSQAYPEKIRKIGGISIIGNHSLPLFEDALKRIENGEIVEYLEYVKKPKLGFPRILRNSVIGIVPVSEGCLSNCSYCSTKFSRGRLYSYEIEDIKREVEKLLKVGVKEIWLSSQDMGVYGMDKGKNLSELLREVVEINKEFNIRVGMMHPGFVKLFLKEMLEAFDNEKIYKFFHLPVQSGSNKILRLMKRNYTREDYEYIVKQIKRKYPLSQIWSDMIVGFPEETEEDFEMSVDLINKTKPDWVNVSRFSSRTGTEAQKMKQIPTEVKKKRSKIMSELVDKISKEINKNWLGWRGEILITEIGKDGFVGRNFAYKPVVVHSEEDLLGKKVEVIIKDFDKVLFGEIL